ncbi:hypothetical protein OBBRIDRAFT_737547 [Obba rivulosa]|uniref:Uncharacterized protein n=1 Tax=Obba rivulosa TaxID=1052685 RepID=A0A8E2ALG3_9APHY|nr:hypothetical protein OBBRIDRAFT_737547 [Obba rivulosa]
MSSFLVLNAVFSLLSLSFVIPVSAVLQNVTIDDTNGDPFTGQQFVYLPEDKWAAGQDCPTCAAQPDPSRVMDQSWHDSSHWANDSNTIPSASVIFQGTALYVYCILNNFWGNSDMTFYIDDMYMGHYYCANGGCPGLEYSVLVYSNNSLEAGRNHTFTLANGENGGPQSLVLLDYIQYT